MDSPVRVQKSKKDRPKKKKLQDVRSYEQDSSIIEVSDSDISIRNLKNEPINDILSTYPEHESYLKRLYETQILQYKRSFKPPDFPDMVALDIVSSEQFTAMVAFLEKNIVRNAEVEHNYSDLIFDLIIPEWALAAFCRKFHCSRRDAIERLRMQPIAIADY